MILAVLEARGVYQTPWNRFLLFSSLEAFWEASRLEAYVNLYNFCSLTVSKNENHPDKQCMVVFPFFPL